MSAGPASGTKVGWGFDVHPLDGSPPLVLGGIVVSEIAGVSATSDGDVLAHAVTDALLGACALGDIGEHFPSEDPANAGVSSMTLLREAASVALRRGLRPSHLDATVIAQEIRVAPYRLEIASSLAEAVGMSADDVSVKATTTDGLGFIGEGRGLGAVAVVTMERAS